MKERKHIYIQIEEKKTEQKPTFLSIYNNRYIHRHTNPEKHESIREHIEINSHNNTQRKKKKERTLKVN